MNLMLNKLVKKLLSLTNVAFCCEFVKKFKIFKDSASCYCKIHLRLGCLKKLSFLFIILVVEQSAGTFVCVCLMRLVGII